MRSASAQGIGIGVGLRQEFSTAVYHILEMEQCNMDNNLGVWGMQSYENSFVVVFRPTKQGQDSGRQHHRCG